MRSWSITNTDTSYNAHFRAAHCNKNNSVNFYKPQNVSFGQNTGIFSKIYKSSCEKIPKDISEKTFDALAKISTRQKDFYQSHIENYINEVKNNSSFRKNFNISKEIAGKISKEQLFTSSKDPALKRFLKNLISPLKLVNKAFKAFVDTKIGKNIFPKSYAKIQEFKRQQKVLDNYKSFEGLLESVKIWENKYGQAKGLAPLGRDDRLLISQEELIEKITRRRLKSVNPDKGQYSSPHLMLMTRGVTGGIYAYFLGTDAYNTTMRLSQNKNEADSERTKRMLQEASRIGLSLYIQQILLGTFEKFINRNIINALLVSGASTASSEIFGRMLVSKPVVPSSKEEIDKLEKEFNDSNSLRAKVGKFISGKPFDNKNKEVSFGSLKASKIFQKEQLVDLLHIVKKIDDAQYEFFTKTINDSIGSSFDKLQEIPIGTEIKKKEQIIESVFHIEGFKNLFKSAKNKLGDEKNYSNSKTEEINGVKNMLLWLEKQCERKKIDIKNPKAEDIEKLGQEWDKMILKVDASKETEYDANIFTQANMFLSRSITTIFLVIDAYNLATQYSNNDKKEAGNAAASRGFQEFSRISISSYITSIFHTLFSKTYNASLLGALSIVSTTSAFNDSLSRWVVGVPISAKNSDELEKLDKENLNSSNPFKRYLAKYIGKRQAPVVKAPSSNYFDLFEKNSTFDKLQTAAYKGQAPRKELYRQ